MPDKYKVLSEIIELCLYIDLISCSTYKKFALKSKDPSLAAEWEARAKEEKRHIRFWKQALVLSKQKHLPLIFKNHMKVKNKLTKIKHTTENILSEFDSYDMPSKELSLAFLLETYMLQPAFTTMFHDYSFIDKSIDKNYGKHILEFINMTKLFYDKHDSLHIELLNETLYDLYITNKELLASSHYDSLTEIYNRRGFFNNAKPILSLAERKKISVGIIMIDFDNFKEINDLSGHQAGDKALKTAASIIKKNLRESCISGRYGGDEFIILSDIENSKSLEIVCERLRKNIDEKSKETSGVHFTISLGAATSTISRQYEESLAKIINKADENLYKAKKNGKNSWVV